MSEIDKKAIDKTESDSVTNKVISRRDVLKAGVLGLAGTVIAPGAANATRLALPDMGAFDISFRNLHTGDMFRGTYRVGNKYLPDAFDEINYVLRDFRVGEDFPMDPRTIDILYLISQKAETNWPFEILSAYRSPKTNAMLQRASDGVADNSLHMTGQAMDIRMPGFSTRRLRDVAQSLRAGGVGYYPNSNFVHIDTGKRRYW